MANAHLNTAFVIIPAVGGNNGWSDPSLFASFLSKAKARGFSVHGWIPTYYRTSSTPNWTSSTEQQAQANWAVAVLNAYPQLDGVHLDYIRYMNYSNINSSQMNGVNAVVSAVHSAVKSKYPSKVVTAAVFTDDPRWADFNTEAVPSWFRSYVSANPSSIYGTSNVPQSFKY
jgi:uncharacterized lipoprotein YddW (UPF0748 family)